MKKLIYVLLLFIFTNISYNVSAYDLEVIKDELEQIGLSEEYSDNITYYLENMSISEEEFNSIIEDGEDILDQVSTKKSLSDFKFSELFSLYGKCLGLADKLGLKVKVDIKNRQIDIRDENTSGVLFKGGPTEIKTLYTNYLSSNDTIDIYDFKREYAQEYEKEYEKEQQNISENYINNEDKIEIHNKEKVDKSFYEVDENSPSIHKVENKKVYDDYSYFGILDIVVIVSSSLALVLLIRGIRKIYLDA